MSGHGWVIPIASGARSRCGGPGMCTACQDELSMLNRVRRVQPNPPIVALQLAAYDLQQARNFAGGPTTIESAAIEAMALAIREIETLKARIQSLEGVNDER